MTSMTKPPAWWRLLETTHPKTDSPTLVEDFKRTIDDSNAKEDAAAKRTASIIRNTAVKRSS